MCIYIQGNKAHTQAQAEAQIAMGGHARGAPVQKRTSVKHTPGRDKRNPL